MDGKKGWKRWLSPLRMIAGVLLLLLLTSQPELRFALAPVIDLVGAFGLEGLLLVFEVQLVIWFWPVIREHVGPWLTRCWNRYAAPRLGRGPSGNILADLTLGFFHRWLCRGGPEGVFFYLCFIAVCAHFALLAPPPVV